MARTPLGSRLPDFPWNALEPAKQKAASHPEGIINLSVGSPVDDVAPAIQEALAEAAAVPGYPQTIGTPELRAAIRDSLERRYGVEGVEAVLPVVGTKEAIALLPMLLGVSGKVIIPTVAYPTYEVAALVAGAEPVRNDSPELIPDEEAADIDLVFINSPSNPTGEVASVEKLRAVVEWAQRNDVIVASDECYLGLAWDGVEAHSLLDPLVAQGNFHNLLAIHSLSKTSNLAGYRSGFFAGDPELIGELTEVRKHSGLMMPGPIQAATVVALNDDEQEAQQKAKYARRREVLKKALLDAGFSIEHSDAGLYLWVTRGEDAWDTVDWFAERGILVAPGVFYGTQSPQHVRIALTTSDDSADAVAGRLQS